jgi:predicted histone-like DNA-binding protein
MAKFYYELRKNNNSSSKSAGRYFAYAKTLETMDNRKMANHIAEHGSVYTPDVIYGVLEKYRNCVVEMLLQSRRVKINGLGTFFATLTNAGNGADTPKKFSPVKNIKALHIRFLPEQEHEISLASTEFIKKAEFVNIADLARPEDEEQP